MVVRRVSFPDNPPLSWSGGQSPVLAVGKSREISAARGALVPEALDAGGSAVRDTPVGQAMPAGIPGVSTRGACRRWAVRVGTQGIRSGRDVRKLAWWPTRSGYCWEVSSTGVVRVWHASDAGWGVLDSPDTPGGAYATGHSLRVEAVADLSQPVAPLGLRPGTEVEFEWSETVEPIEGLRYLVQRAWPQRAVTAPPSRPDRAFSTSLWNSVGGPGPDGLTVMREVGLDDIEIPQIQPPVLSTTVGVVRRWVDEEGWGVLDSDATPGGAWVHFSIVAGNGFRRLIPGQAVEFTYERAEQDGYSFRAVSARGL